MTDLLTGQHLQVIWLGDRTLDAHG